MTARIGTIVLICYRCYFVLLVEQGINAEQIIADRHLRAAIEIDANSAAHNSTVREYETINESSGAAADVEMTEGADKDRSPGGVAKKQRRH